MKRLLGKRKEGMGETIYEKYAELLTSVSDKNACLLASRLYSYHYDTLLNGLLRFRPINEKLARYFKEEKEGGHASWFSSESGYPQFNEVCKGIREDRVAPISLRDSTSTSEQWTQFVNGMYDRLQYLYESLLKYRITFEEPIVVYRGLYLEPENQYDFTSLTGFSSTSYSINEAIHIMMSDYEKQQPLLMDNFVLLEIKIPPRTPLFSTNLCALQVEDEIVLTEDARVEVEKETTHTFKTWIDCYKITAGELMDSEVKTGGIEDMNIARRALVKAGEKITVRMISGQYQKLADLKRPNFHKYRKESLRWVVEADDTERKTKRKRKKKRKGKSQRRKRSSKSKRKSGRKPRKR